LPGQPVDRSLKAFQHQQEVVEEVAVVEAVVVVVVAATVVVPQVHKDALVTAVRFFRPN